MKGDIAMAKIVDITEKLSFEENPKIKIKNVEVEINSEASTMLKLLQLIGDGENITPNHIMNMYELIFKESERKKIEKLKLQFEDFQTIVRVAMDIVVGGNEEGE